MLVLGSCVVLILVGYAWWRSLQGPHLPRGLQTPDLSKSGVPRKPSVVPERDRYSKNKVPEELDAIVIGSGIGGLSVAGFLSRVGKKVLVLEQHYVAGGCCHTFESGGYSFSTGIHYIGNIEKRKPILDLICERSVDWAQNGHERQDGSFIYDEIVIGDKVYEFPAGADKFIEQMVGYFPDEREAIEKYVDLIKKSAQKDLYFNLKIVKPMWLQALLRKLLCGNFFALANRTAYDVVRELTANEELIAVLCGQFGDYGPPPKEATFFMHASVVNHYLEGGFFPAGGPGMFARQIIPVIEASGGRCLVGRKVQQIIVEKGHATGVVMDNGHRIHAKCVVSDAGVVNTFHKMLPAQFGEAFGLPKMVKDVPPSISYTYLFVGLKGTPSELKLRSSNIWVWPERDYSAMLDKFLADPEKAPIPLFIAFESAKDTLWEENKENEGKATAIILTVSKPGWFEQWKDERCMHRSEEYKQKKEMFAQRMFEEGLFRFYPHLRDKVAHYDVGTPLSTMHYINAPHGECYGLDCPPQRFTKYHQLQPTTLVPGLYLTGQDVCTLGFTGALMGGVLAAHCILGYGGLGDLVSDRNLIKDLLHYDKELKQKMGGAKASLS